ncbi:hypothetical protein, partial [Pseudomonas gingeri]|uniref:hypothetical protein n=1 Tax=Pseudomonas gingeri TaxID=117681 RepID=UPI001C430715
VGYSTAEQVRTDSGWPSTVKYDRFKKREFYIHWILKPDKEGSNFPFGSRQTLNNGESVLPVVGDFEPMLHGS